MTYKCHPILKDYLISYTKRYTMIRLANSSQLYKSYKLIIIRRLFPIKILLKTVYLVSEKFINLKISIIYILYKLLNNYYNIIQPFN